ncbi:MAG: metallophosphatase family protein, partial [Clostridia bacterium]|nr:metallophosphatase family protein [Clostridia bacterium]
SDIHGNLSALDAALEKAEDYAVEAFVLLGDLIDYGMRSNETVARIRELTKPILCNIYGNHETAIVNGDYSRFSSERGKDSAKYTSSVLSADTFDYIQKNMLCDGKYEFCIGDKKCLAVHGSLKDVFWKSVNPDGEFSEYEKYDYVFSGHSHIPHYFEKYYKSENEIKRFKKKTVFLNPGSVGQPRNHNNAAQFVVLDTDTEEMHFVKASYDIEKEQSLYKGQIDEFYKNRLKEGV